MIKQDLLQVLLISFVGFMNSVVNISVGSVMDSVGSVGFVVNSFVGSVGSFVRLVEVDVQNELN
jgi:hypothetical protein